MAMITQKWEGYVDSIDKFAGEFSAVLRDITNPNNPDESCVLQISDVLPERFQDTIKLGMIFNWTIIVDDQGVGKSTIKFSEEVWTAEDLARIHEEAKILAEKFGLPYPPSDGS